MTFPLPGANWSYLHTLTLKATTGAGGFALQNATPTILSWTAPNDGLMHRVIVIAGLDVTVAETGGKTGFHYYLPDGTVGQPTLFLNGLGAGSQNALTGFMVQAGSVFQVNQTSALTAGTATLWAEIWAL